MFTLQRHNSPRSNVPAEADDYSQLITLAQGGRLQRACEEGRLFSVASQAKVATTAGLTTTWTGLGISNPSASGKNAIIHEFGYGMEIAASDDGSIGLMTSDTTGFAAALTIRNCLDGTESANVSVMYADDGATIATPVLRRVFGAYGTGATNLVNALGPYVYDLKGGLIIPPGRSVMTFTTTATTACFTFHFIWEEISE